MYQQESVELYKCTGSGLPYPQLVGTDQGCVRINACIRHRAYQWETQLRVMHRRAAEMQQPVQPGSFSTEASCQIMRADQQFFSYFCDMHIALGRAAPKLLRYSETYDRTAARRLRLEDLFWRSTDWRPHLRRQILRQIQAENQPAYTYFSQMRIPLHPRRFYLTDQGLVLWFTAGEIAPCNTGLPSFLLTSEMLSPLLRCNL